MSLNLEQIAKLAGVSKATASSVLNGKAEKYRISKSTQEKVLDIAEKNHYRPNHSAAALRRGKSQSIGIIVPDFENRSYLRIAKRLEALARKEGYQLIIASSDDDAETEMATAQMLISRGVDALLVSTCLTDPAPYQKFLSRGTPIIALDRAMTSAFSNVISDDRKGAFSLTKSLPLESIESITLIGALPELEISKLRELGFKDAISTYPKIKSYCYYGDHFDTASGAKALQQAIIDQKELPTAIVTTSYSLLEGVIAHMQKEYPFILNEKNHMTKLATFGNSRLLDFLPIPVASLPQQYEYIAEASWMLAKQAVEGNYQPQKIIIQRTVTKR